MYSNNESQQSHNINQMFKYVLHMQESQLHEKIPNMINFLDQYPQVSI